MNAAGGRTLVRAVRYDVAADGRFSINTVVGEGASDPITLIQNWKPEVVQQ